MRTYESIVKGHNIPKPGVPESFKVLVKELQSLCLDVRVLDENGHKIEMQSEDDDDDFRDNMRDAGYRPDDSELLSAGYAIEDVDLEEAEDIPAAFEEDEDNFEDGDLYDFLDEEEEDK